jgi:hypothetical protein
MSQEEINQDWKLKLRYGKLSTPYKHYTAIADGIAGELADGFICKKGEAFMAMKMWAEDTNQAADMISVIGGRIGFKVTGDIQIYDTEAEQPPKERPYGYGINFTPYGE